MNRSSHIVPNNGRPFHVSVLCAVVVLLSMLFHWQKDPFRSVVFSYYTCKRLQTSNLHSTHMLNSYAASLVAHFLQCFQIHLAVVFLAENRPKRTHKRPIGINSFWVVGGVGRADDLTIRERLRGPRNCQFHHCRRF